MAHRCGDPNQPGALLRSLRLKATAPLLRGAGSFGTLPASRRAVLDATKLLHEAHKQQIAAELARLASSFADEEVHGCSFTLDKTWEGILGDDASFSDAYGKTMTDDPHRASVAGQGALRVRFSLASEVWNEAIRPPENPGYEEAVRRRVRPKRPGDLWHRTTGVYGGGNPGVQGDSNTTSASAIGVKGTITSTTPGPGSAGVRGQNNGTGSYGIGVWGSQAGSRWGVHGSTPNGRGVFGYATGTSGVNYGVFGKTSSPSGYAGYFQGRVRVTGELAVAGAYAQLPVRTGAPPASDCNSAAQAGRMVVRTDGPVNLYICLGTTGWTGK